MLLYTLDLPNRVDARVRETVGEILSRLRQVFFVRMSGVGRQLPRRTELPIDRDVFNRSYPIMAQMATFERLRRDPRDIALDLDRILMSTFHGPETVQVWHQVFGRLEYPHRATYPTVFSSQATSGQPLVGSSTAKARKGSWERKTRGGRRGAGRRKSSTR